MKTDNGALRLGVIGCGGIAGGYGEEKGLHLLALEQLGVPVKTYCDIRLPAAQRRLAQFGGERATTDPADIFRDPDIGAVLICTRHDSHAPLAIAAAAAGKHVFVEKPLALTEAECEAVVAAGRKHGVKIMVGFTKRSTPALRALAPLRGRARTIVVEAIEPAWGPEPFWGMDPLAGGGQVFMCGTHIADALLWLADSEPVSIYASGGPVTPSGPTCLDKVHAVIEFANGTHGVFVSGDMGASERLSKFSIQVYTGKGGAVATNRWMDLDVTGIPGVESVHGGTENFGDAMRDFVDCIRHDRPSPIPPEDGLRATRLIVRMIESIRRRQPVPWVAA
jgi:predicted dehydrogenase